MHPFRFIGVGLFAAGLIVFASFFFKFLIFAILISMAFRLMSGRHYYRNANYSCAPATNRRPPHHFGGPYRDRYDADGIVPSDY